LESMIASRDTEFSRCELRLGPKPTFIVFSKETS
jgi:hypothetical protein